MYKPVARDFILFYFLHDNTKKIHKENHLFRTLFFSNINSLHHLSRGERGLFIYLFIYSDGPSLLFSTQKEDQTKSLTCRVKIITIFLSFQNIDARIANKCSRAKELIGRWRNIHLSCNTDAPTSAAYVHNSYTNEQEVWKEELKHFVRCKLMVISYPGVRLMMSLYERGRERVFGGYKKYPKVHIHIHSIPI